MSPRLRTLVACVVLALTAQTVYADPNKMVAHRAYLEGKKLYDVGEYQKALDAFKRAYLAYEDPSFLFNMAQCNRLVGDKQEAVRGYKSYLRNFPEARNREEVKRIVAELEESLQHEREAAEAQVRAANSPPQGTLAPDQKPPEVTTALVEARSAPPPPKKKSYWWAYTIVGVVVVGAAVGLGVGLTQGPASEAKLGEVRFP